MAWNQPTSASSSKSRGDSPRNPRGDNPRGDSPRNSKGENARGLNAGDSPRNPLVGRGRWLALGGVAVVAVIAWLLWPTGDGTGETPPPRKEALVKEVKPTVVTTNAAPRAKVRPYDDYDHEKCYRDENGILRDKRGGCRVIDPAATYLEPQEFGSSLKGVFTRTSDQCISRLLMFRPGNMGVPDCMDYHSEAFQEDFRESLKEPIIIGKDDSELVKRVKQALIDARIEICDRMRNGEKLGDILTETRSELLRLGEFRKSAISELRTQLGSGELSNIDAEMFIEAVNRMLEEHGIRPVNKTTMLKLNLKLMDEE